MVPLSIHGLERELRARLRRAGEGELAERALDGVRLTDDGATIYVHIFTKPDWPNHRPGDAYPLAFADYEELRTLAQWRGLIEDARLLLIDDFPRIVAWLRGTA